LVQWGAVRMASMDGRQPDQGSQPDPFPRAAPVRPERKGCGFWLAAFLALLFFGATALLLMLLVGTLVGRGAVEAGARGPVRFVEETLEGEGDNKILLLSIRGIITEAPSRRMLWTRPGLVETFRDMLRQARGDDHVRAVLLYVDSPGGGITASDVLYRRIRDFREEREVPVVGLLGDVAASGGYYVASACDYLVAHPTTVTGSIGVIMPLVGIQQLLSKIGVEARPIKSGEMKDMGSPFRGLTEEEQKILQDIVDRFHRRFVDVVYEGMKRRGVEIGRDRLEQYCDGRVFTGEEAKTLGFVDEVGYLEDAVRIARERAGLGDEEARVVTYRSRVGLLDLILASRGCGEGASVTIRLDGLGGSEAPRFLYLWTVGQAGVVSSFRP